jgi:VanZ family protein
VNTFEEKLNKTWLRWLPALLMMAVIYVASATPANKLQNFRAWDLLVKKGGHFTGYLLLSIAYAFGLKARSPKTWLTAFILAVLYAGSDEFHQVFSAGRHPSLVDVGIDSFGAATGLAIWYLVRRRWLEVEP